MTEILVLQHNNVYGTFELQRVYSRNYTIGVSLAIFFHLLLIGSYYFAMVISNKEISETPYVKPETYAGLPQTFIGDVKPQIKISGPISVPKAGIPMPVPDDEVSSEQSIASQKEIVQQQATNSVDNIDTDNIRVVISEKIVINEEPNPEIFIPVEKQPEIVIGAKPEYPEIAKRAGITGKVFVRVLIDKEGRPKKAVVVKSDSELFNQSAIDASMKSAFTPALQNQHPIAVWIVLPYRFTLEGQQ